MAQGLLPVHMRLIVARPLLAVRSVELIWVNYNAA